MFDTLIAGGIVIDHEKAPARLDVGIVGGKVAALCEPGSAQGAVTIDATGCMLLPGLIDAHAHLREPGLTHKEDFSSGTHAAALGGVTTVLDMPTDEPWTASAAQLADKMAMAEGRIHVDVGFQAVVTQDISLNAGLLELGPVSFELFTADVPESYLFGTMEAVSQRLQHFAESGTLVGISPGDQSILTGSAARLAGDGSIQAFLASRPPLAEAGGIARAVLAAAGTGARVHVRQINSALGVAAWRRLRDMADVSVETTPQNLFFTAADYETVGAGLKASPPLRQREDVAALREALSAGLIDMVATDHAPHSPAEKAADYAAFADIPGGMPGLQTLLQTMLKLVDEGVIGLGDIARMCAANPASRFGLKGSKGRIAPGFDADILVLDMRRESVISHAEQVTKAGYTPFDGWRVGGSLRRVLLRGREIVRDGLLLGPATGQVVRAQLG
jgi:dihydroorotase